jgi:hypothetical protein
VCACEPWVPYPLADGERGELAVGRDGEVTHALDGGEVADGERVRWFGGLCLLHVAVAAGKTAGQHHHHHERGQTTNDTHVAKRCKKELNQIKFELNRSKGKKEHK